MLYRLQPLIRPSRQRINILLFSGHYIISKKKIPKTIITPRRTRPCLQIGQTENLRITAGKQSHIRSDLASISIWKTGFVWDKDTQKNPFVAYVVLICWRRMAREEKWKKWWRWRCSLFSDGKTCSFWIGFSTVHRIFLSSSIAGIVENRAFYRAQTQRFRRIA